MKSQNLSNAQLAAHIAHALECYADVVYTMSLATVEALRGCAIAIEKVVRQLDDSGVLEALANVAERMQAVKASTEEATAPCTDCCDTGQHRTRPPEVTSERQQDGVDGVASICLPSGSHPRYQPSHVHHGDS